MKTVLPASDPLYLRNACRAVTAARGSDAASENDKALGFSAM